MDCIFCKIIAGEFGTEFVLENDDFVVFNDIQPKADKHLLVVPKKHIKNLNEVNDKDLIVKMFETLKEVVEKLGIKEYRTVINTGAGAGQSVFHLHMHILSGDSLGDIA